MVQAVELRSVLFATDPDKYRESLDSSQHGVIQHRLRLNHQTGTAKARAAEATQEV